MNRRRGHSLGAITNELNNTRDAQASLGYSDRRICCDDCPSTSVIRDA